MTGARQRPGEGPAAQHRAPLTAREALLFEAGIKLGGVFHQYLGTPISGTTAGGVARTIARALELQPYVVRATVRIRPGRGGALGRGRFAYRYLTAEMLHVRVTLLDGPARVVAELVHRPDLRYPLMHVLAATGRGPRPGPATRARRSARRAGRPAPRTGRSDE